VGGRLLKVILRIQAGFYLVTGLWPLAHMPSFERITGPKLDDWLVYTVGLLLASIGATLWAGSRRPTTPMVMLAMLAALSLAAVDTYFALAGRISSIYLLDAAAELALVVALAFGVRQARREGSPHSR
jgi:hypothetical protein